MQNTREKSINKRANTKNEPGNTPESPIQATENIDSRLLCRKKTPAAIVHSSEVNTLEPYSYKQHRIIKNHNY